MSDDLTPSDYAILLLLRNEDREISNTELDEIYGFRLTGSLYAKLNGLGYIISNTQHRPYRHLLSSKGVKIVGRPLEIDEAQVDATEKRTIKERILWAALAAEHRKNADAPAVDKTPAPDTRSLDERVRDAYDQVSVRAGEWVDLTAIRPLLPDVPKAELDRALEKMLDSPDVRLDPEVHRHRLGKEEKAAAVRIGGEDRHKLAIGLR
ncbi:hypothetical protein [Paractinoplanes globisporus]|uniref:Transcription factor n=1 Tax=Paractinoplanes globisporus TaxID=113565 RepID=A0ABW6W5K1_9ACTN|nr:hypothetical protein [Actinoplanes globisporus]